MPFGPVFLPSIGLSLLKAELAERSVRARVLYFSIPFAERVGQAFYQGVAAEGRPPVEDLAGEWIFSRALHESTPEEEASYLDELDASAGLTRRILRARQQVEGFLEECLEQVARERPKLVGFTSVFQQHAASLGLARRIKRSLPGVLVVFGGANCEGVMGAETVRRFPFVDAAVSGEADLVFPDLVERVLQSRSLEGLPGVRTPLGVEAEFRSGVFGSAPMVRDMDALPYPDYSDYFEQFGASRYGREWQPGVFFETSRGCWWGERMHCTFCGLNGQTMAYRSKSARRAIDELQDLTRRHPDCDVQVTDNILDMGYFKDFLPELARRRLGVSLYYETKANLRKDQVRLLRDAGIRTLQPGIESLSDAVLKLMRKGVTGLRNIQLLKWCEELGVEPYWNLIWGFPGEPAEEYARMARLVPLLTHLRPPLEFSGIRLDRFSPNFFDREKLGFVDVAPLPPYRHIYRLPDEALANLAYYFSFGYREARDVEAYVRPLERELVSWKRTAESSALFSVDLEGSLFLWDLRPAGQKPLTLLRGLDRILYQACDAACDLRQLAGTAARAGFSSLADDEIEARLEPLVEGGLLIREGARHLALAVPLGDYAPRAAAVERFRDTVERLGTRTPAGWVVPLDGSMPRDGPRGRGRRPEAARRRLPPSLVPGPSWFSLGEAGLSIRFSANPVRKQGGVDGCEEAQEKEEEERPPRTLEEEA
jgi:ribosomal peptide maturation radical SAM protein 1